MFYQRKQRNQSFECFIVDSGLFLYDISFLQIGSWTANPHVDLFTRYGTEFFAFVLGKNPDTGAPCTKAIYAGGRREYRHMTGPGVNDVGGYVCLEDSP